MSDHNDYKIGVFIIYVSFCLSGRVHTKPDHMFCPMDVAYKPFTLNSWLMASWKRTFGEVHFAMIDFVT